MHHAEASTAVHMRHAKGSMAGCLLHVLQHALALQRGMLHVSCRYLEGSNFWLSS